MRARPVLRLLGLVVVTAGYFAGLAAACPESCIHLPGNVDFCTPAAQFDTTLTDSVCCRCGGYRTAFDVPEGTLYALGWSSWDGCEARVSLEDDFVVEGLPAGTLVALAAHLDLTLNAQSLMGPGHASASMTEGVSNSASVNWDDLFDMGNTRQGVLTVPLSAIAGTPFHMRYFVRGYAGELTTVEWLGTFSFSGLPHGTSITSCKGFNEKPVPARTMSWGRLKTTYH